MLVATAHGARLSRASVLIKALSREMTTKKRAAATTAGKQVAKAPRIEEVPAVPEAGGAAGPVVQYEGPLVQATLLRRYKRFLGDVQLPSAAAAAPAAEARGAAVGDAAAETVVHVPNTGPMTGLLDRLPAPALLSCSSSATRKYAHTLEWIRPEPEGTWVGVHSAKANAMARHLLAHRLLPGLPPYTGLQPEVRYGSDGKSRVDFVLHGPGEGWGQAGGGRATTHVEVKSVTLAEDLPEGSGRIALFPDTVSFRAQRHVQELTALAQAGGAAALLFVVQRGDCCAFAPCHAKDPVYGRLVVEAAEAGVAVLAAVCSLDAGTGEVRFGGALPVQLRYKMGE